MRTTRSIAAFTTALLVLALASGCSPPPEDLSAHGDPAQRLIGHWVTDVGDQLYYGPIDAASGKGPYTLIQASGNTFRHAYRIEGRDPARQTIRATYLFADGDSAAVGFTMSADGKTLTSAQEITGMMIESEATRVDDRTAP